MFPFHTQLYCVCSTALCLCELLRPVQSSPYLKWDSYHSKLKKTDWGDQNRGINLGDGCKKHTSASDIGILQQRHFWVTTDCGRFCYWIYSVFQLIRSSLITICIFQFIATLHHLFPVEKMWAFSSKLQQVFSMSSIIYNRVSDNLDPMTLQNSAWTLSGQ